ncbi:MAG TPA: hypothetical protein VMD55_04275 [Terracidiphilus sp.]|nr:hypothetical protein [Terracidiphilus sp.]
MRASCIAVLFFLGCAALCAQSPLSTDTPAPDPSAEIGFSYTLPSGWVVVEIKPSPPAEAAQPQSRAANAAIKGTACIRVPMTARRGNPSSVIVVVELPFDCYGQPMTGQDLAGFGLGAADGLKQEFDLIDPVFGLYSLGSHRLWIERAKGSPKGHPETQYTMEIACSMLKKGAACWMTMAADEASLHAFENSSVTLDGDAATPLVPANAFDKPPS